MLMRILIVSYYYSEHGGGVEIVAGELATRFVCLDAEVTWAGQPNEYRSPI